MVVLTELVKSFSCLLKPHSQAQIVLDFLKNDEQVTALLSASNSVAIQRLGYTDHGITHAHIASYNAAKMLILLNQKKIQPSLVTESNLISFEDSLEVVIAAAYLHDIGNAVMRAQHELFSMVLSREILNRLYKKSTEITERKKATIMEGIIAHMGNYPATSLESKVVSVADACDMEKGRARIPYSLGKKDIHSLSALSIKTVRVRAGTKKPLAIHVEMDTSTGIFQVEELLIKKIKAASFEQYVEINAYIHDRNETIAYLE